MTVPVEEPTETWELSERSRREKTIKIFASVVFALIALISLGIVGDWFLRAPTLPLATDKAALDSYQALNTIAMSRAKDMFDLMIVKALLPVFATIIGVLLGRRGNESA